MPKAKWSDADDAVFLASSYGLTPDPWQVHILDGWLGRLADDRWACGRCGLAVPRQNGKNGTLEVRELYGMVALGEKFLHTAHEVKTARKAFTRLKYFFGDTAADPGAKFPELNALVREVRSTNGQEAIILSNGGSVEFVARSRGSGRGFTVDVLVCDEAQELTDEQLEALLPTISSAPLGNPQLIMTGTPPSVAAVGEVFTRMHDAAHEGKNARLSWHEWAVKGDVDVYDRKLWAATNPSLGIRLQLSVIEDEAPPGMTVDGFARERLGRWLSVGESIGPFPQGSWTVGVDAKSVIAEDSPLGWGLDVSVSRETAHIAVCGFRSDGVPQVEKGAAAAGTDWVVDWFADPGKPHRRSVVAVQGRGAPVSTLIDELRKVEGLTVLALQGEELSRATGQIFDAVNRSAAEPRAGLVHLPWPELDNAAQKAILKLLEGGGMLWDRKRSLPHDISSLVAATNALAALSQSDSHSSVYEDRDLLVLEG